MPPRRLTAPLQPRALDAPAWRAKDPEALMGFEYRLHVRLQGRRLGRLPLPLLRNVPL